jgi:hypothetical protein
MTIERELDSARAAPPAYLFQSNLLQKLYFLFAFFFGFVSCEGKQETKKLGRLGVLSRRAKVDGEFEFEFTVQYP